MTASQRWRNWSGIASSQPTAYLRPANEAELIDGLSGSTGALRVTGASHSFTPLCATAGTLVDIASLQGVIGHEPHACQATVWAGTRLKDLGQPLWALGQSLSNQGDVDVQTLAGACGTSTHGTGRGLGSLSSLITRLRLVTVAGEVLEADRQQAPELLLAASVSLGALGVITQLTLQNRPRYRLDCRESVVDLGQVLEELETLLDRHRHVEFFSFFRADQAILKVMDETDAPDQSPPIELPVDAVLNVSAWLADRVPGLDAPLQRLLLRAAGGGSRRVGPAWQVFPSARNARFNEMEYEVPAENGPDCLRTLMATVRASRLRTLYPVEYRQVAGDDRWLSPFFGRDSASISVHQHVCADHRALFELVEPVFWRYGGRPHWGKLHSLDARRLAPLYPHWPDFQRLRQRLDPQGRLLNDHLRRILLP